MSENMFRSNFYVSIFVICLVSVSLFAVASCSGTEEECIHGDAVDIRYSSLLDIVDCDGYTVVNVKNPWGKGRGRRYLLVPDSCDVPANLPKGVLLRTPLENVILFSGVHADVLDELGAASVIAGVCDKQYIYSSAVKRGLKEGKITDCGSSLNVNGEAVVRVAPDAIFVLPFENGGYGKLEKMPYPLVECADYMETSPLGCAEWIRFYGRLAGRAVEADSIFNAVCEEYDALCSMVAGIDYRPKLMCELKSSSAWYVPGGKSTLGQMYMDAGADYLFAGYERSGSVPLSYEVVLDKAADADIWLFKYNSEVEKNKSSLLSDFAGYSHFGPFKENNVYACNTSRNNLFEEASFHPERLLRELVALFHPSLLPEYKLLYYEKIK